MARPIRKASQPSPEAASAEHECAFCKRAFASEKTLAAHACEQRRRYLARGDKAVRLGLAAFQRFYATFKRAKTPQIEDFEKSQFYTAFVRFGAYLADINAVNPNAFVDFLVKSEIKIDRWCAPTVYESYLRELNKVETPTDAVERNILLMQQWEMEDPENRHWTDFFRKVAPPQATLWIKTGRISPWVLFTASSVPALLERMSEEQLGMVDSVLGDRFWESMLNRHRKEVDLIRETLNSAGL